METSHFQVLWRLASVLQDLTNDNQRRTIVNFEGTNLWVIEYPLIFRWLRLASFVRPLPKLLGGPEPARTSLPLPLNLSTVHIVQSVAETRQLRGSPSPEGRVVAQRLHLLPSTSSAL